MPQTELYTSLSPGEFLNRLKTIPHSSYGHSIKEELKFRFSSSQTNLQFYQNGFVIIHKGKWFGAFYRKVTCQLKEGSDGRTILLHKSEMNRITKVLVRVISYSAALFLLGNSIVDIYQTFHHHIQHLLAVSAVIILFGLIMCIILVMINNSHKKEVVYMLEDLITELEK